MIFVGGWAINCYNRIYRSLMAIILSAILVGCSGPASLPIPAFTLSPDQIDKSPFTSLPCAAPCWHGLVIGNSSESEVRSILPTLTYINQKTVAYNPITNVRGPDPSVAYPGIEIIADCVRPPQPCLTMDVADHILTQIDILLNYPILIGDVIADLGPPDYVGYQLMGAETLTCQVELVWYSKQLVLNTVPESWESSNPKDNCIIVKDTGKTISNLKIFQVSYKLIPWVDYTLAQNGSEFYKFAGTIPEK
jgi:hypothetical protein